MVSHAPTFHVATALPQFHEATKAVRLDHSPVPTHAPSSPGTSFAESAGSPQAQALGSPYNSCAYASPIQKPKQKGEAMPMFERLASPKRQESSKIFDEAHHFGLCEHYAKLLDQAKKEGFQNVKWPTGFTLFHLAAKKNCPQFVQWLHDHDLGEIHAIDDFGKKPIDYACPLKRESVHGMLDRMMHEIPPPICKKQDKYEAIKNGTYVPKKKAPEPVMDMASILESNEIAEGSFGFKKNASVMTLYELEQSIPADYKKALKQCSNGWSKMKEENKWPAGVSLLHWAARNGRDEICEFLMVEYGADPHEEDGSGHSAIYHAKLKKHRKLVKSLITRFRK